MSYHKSFNYDDSTTCFERILDEYDVDDHGKAAWQLNNNIEKNMYEKKNYKHYIKSQLNLNLTSYELKTSPVVLVNNTKEFYSELCKKNINQPINVENVQSIIKQYIGHTKSKKTLHMQYSSEELVFLDDLKITVETKDRKYKKELASKGDCNSSINKMETNFIEYNRIQHKGSLFNYIKCKKENYTKLLKHHHLSQEKWQTNVLENLKNEKNNISEMQLSLPIPRDTRHSDKINIARKKVHGSQKEKTKLNKLTVIQPFEDTKILINIDRVSSTVLNNLLRKENKSFYFVVPPIRPSNYFTKSKSDIK
jgi:hypothetical protein